MNLDLNNKAKYILQKLICKKNLTTEEAEFSLNFGIQNLNYLSAVLVLLLAKGYVGDEILGFAKLLHERRRKIAISDCLDIVGTGGDGLKTINISTIAAILSAASGMKVLKHGSNATSSNCGSADLLKNFNINLNLDNQAIINIYKKIGIGFCYAPKFHQTYAKVREARLQLGIPTIFNILGPLLHPASSLYTIIGVYEEKLLGLMKPVIEALPIKKAILVWNDKGLDEIATVGNNLIHLWDGQNWHFYNLDAKYFKMPVGNLKDLIGKDIAYNTKVLIEVLKGESKNTTLNNTIILNVAICHHLLLNKSSCIEESIDYIRDILNSGQGHKLLLKWKEESLKI